MFLNYSVYYYFWKSNLTRTGSFKTATEKRSVRTHCSNAFKGVRTAPNTILNVQIGIQRAMNVLSDFWTFKTNKERSLSWNFSSYFNFKKIKNVRIGTFLNVRVFEQNFEHFFEHCKNTVFERSNSNTNVHFQDYHESERSYLQF